jgi:hypothetical protein
MNNAFPLTTRGAYIQKETINIILSYLPIQVNELVQNNEHQMRVRELEHKVLHIRT